MALSTISPNLSEQFSALVNLAVVTNVLPYIIALSALKVMMEAAKVERSVYLRNMIIALVAMLYSTYAIWASGLQAVMGGVLVMSIGYIIWGFIAPRFTTGTTAARAPAGVAGVAVAAFAIAFLAALPPPSAEAATGPVSTLDRVKQSGKLTLGYRTDARPFSYEDESGNAAGYSVALCEKIAEQVKADLRLPNAHRRVGSGHDGGSLPARCRKARSTCCAKRIPRRWRRAQGCRFSIPIFPGGIGALLRSDSSCAAAADPDERQGGVRAALACIAGADPGAANRSRSSRARPARTGSRAGSTNSSSPRRWCPWTSYEAGIRRVLDRSTNVFFGDRAILLEAAKRSPSARDLIVLDRRFTYEPLALALPARR